MNINTWGVFNHVIIGNDLFKKNMIDPQKKIVLWKCSDKSDISLKIILLTYKTCCNNYIKKQNVNLILKIDVFEHYIKPHYFYMIDVKNVMDI